MLTEPAQRPSPAAIPAALPAGDLREVLRGRDVLCFSHDWTGDPLSKTHLMRLMARDTRVLWVNSIGYRTPSVVSKADMSRAFKKLAAVATPIREVEKNIFVLSPLAVPLYGPMGRMINSQILRYQVKRAMRKLGLRRVINWVFNPAAAVVAGKLGEERVIYYCVDEYTAFSGVGAQRLAKMEERLLSRADLTIVSADLLYQSKAKVNPNTILVRHGVDYSHFRTALEPSTEVPEEVAHLPRRKALEGISLQPMPNLRLVEPLGYLDFMKLVGHSRLVLTDSGGIQEETTVLGVPCLTLRSNTERPATVDEGTNVLVGPDPTKILGAWRQAMDSRPQRRRIPELWDGRAAVRIIDSLTN